MTTVKEWLRKFPEEDYSSKAVAHLKGPRYEKCALETANNQCRQTDCLLDLAHTSEGQMACSAGTATPSCYMMTINFP
jgi:hypothetical protein